MEVAILQNNVVVNIVTANSVAAVTALGFTAVNGTGAVIGDTWSGSAFAPPPAPVKEWPNPLDFMREFTLAEEGAIRAAGKTDATVDVLLARLSAAPCVIASDDLLVTGMNYLVAQGLLSAERKAQILGT
jgi:hypothetical protein